LDTEDRKRIKGENPTIHHYLLSRKRRTNCTITQAIHENGILQMGEKVIMRLFTEHMTRRFSRITIAENCIQQLVLCGMNTIHMAAKAGQEEQITIDEILTAVRKGKAHKSSGQDGLCHEFYKMTWEITNTT